MSALFKERAVFGIVAAIVVAAGILLLFQSNPPSVPTVTTGPLAVSASFYPVAEFARHVGGDLVTVTTVTPATVEPHDYEPTAQQVASLYRSHVFLYNGGGVDAWATRLAPQLADAGVSVAQLSDAVQVLPLSSDEEESPADVPAFDPHIWLAPALAEREVNMIRDAFSAADPAHADAYAANASAYVSDLATLDQEYAHGLASCTSRTVVTAHAAFAYLAAQYHFDVVAISGISPEEEPSAGRLAEIAALAHEKNIQYIYFETLVSPKLSETIANEVGAQTLVFNPLEGLTQEEIDAGADYLSVMRTNLANLETGMLCQ